jgi:CTP:phosphocholine cytidylyltransferase-like protein
MRAIILAAGMGTRLRPLTDSRPKALVEICGESLFERQLRQLREIGIREICVVTGHGAGLFDPWRGQSGLDFVHNELYAERNNLWSMYLARERLGGSIVLEGDVRLADGVLPGEEPTGSCWFVGPRDGKKEEWAVALDSSDRVVGIEVRPGPGLILSGLSYWAEADGPLLSALIAEAALATGSESLFWDEVPRRNLDRIAVRARRIGAGDWAEIDTIEDLEELEARLGESGRRA